MKMIGTGKWQQITEAESRPVEPWKLVKTHVSAGQSMMPGLIDIFCYIDAIVNK